MTADRRLGSTKSRSAESSKSRAADSSVSSSPDMQGVYQTKVRWSIKLTGKSASTPAFRQPIQTNSVTPLTVRRRIPDNDSVRLPTALSPLTERNFRLLWTGQAVSAIGDSLTPVALAFAALMAGHSATALGIVFAVSILGRVIALPMGGVWADRLPRQLVMLTSDWVRAAVHAAIGLLLLSGNAQLWELILQALLYNFAAGFFQPASGALVPQTVTVQKLQQANALMGLSKSLTQVGGPAVSGILVALVGPGWVFVIDAITFVASALSLALLKIPPLAAPAAGARARAFPTGRDPGGAPHRSAGNRGAGRPDGAGPGGHLYLGRAEVASGSALDPAQWPVGAPPGQPRRLKAEPTPLNPGGARCRDR